MEPQGNRHHQPFNGSSRVPDARYSNNFASMPQNSVSNLCNYVMPLSQIVYPPFPYSTFSYPNPAYFAQLSNWRDPTYPPLNFPLDMNTPRNFFNPQNIRVIPRDVRERVESKVINLQSDEEEEKQKNVLVPTSNNTHKPNQKSALVIQIDENSSQKKQNNQIVAPAKKPDIPQKINKAQSQPQKAVVQLQQKKRQKQVETKTKIISKARPREQKVIQKQQKSQKQRKRRLIDNEKSRLRDDKQKEKQKQLQRSERKKYEKNDKAEKVDKIQKAQKAQKYQKTEKNKKTGAIDNKNKVEEVHTKQIAKYMESHGEIRHGKEFQSQIPGFQINNGIDFTKWLQEKRKKLLKRQVGVLTY